LALLAGAAALLLAGCNPARPASPSGGLEKLDPHAGAPEAQHVAEEALGKDAEILLRGDLAGNETEQLLVVNRAGGKVSATGDRSESLSGILITRAAILENSNGKWSEVLLCDEHLKNPKGYLGGLSAARETGWHLEYTKDPKQGLEMKFTPANAGVDEAASKAIFVRWNAEAKRYQSLDPSHRKYLSEAPTLETPESILK
jgi:hypothetical protein